MRHTVSVEDLINYLKKWCVKPVSNTQEQRPVGDELEGADFTSTVEHIHQVYSFLCINCSQSHLKELFQHNPAIFIEKNRQGFGRISLLSLFSVEALAASHTLYCFAAGGMESGVLAVFTT